MSIEMASKVEGETTKNVDGVGYPHDDMIVEAIPKENLGDHDLRSTNRASMSVSMSHFASSRGNIPEKVLFLLNLSLPYTNSCMSLGCVTSLDSTSFDILRSYSDSHIDS